MTNWKCNFDNQLYVYFSTHNDVLAYSIKH